MITCFSCCHTFEFRLDIVRPCFCPVGSFIPGAVYWGWSKYSYPLGVLSPYLLSKGWRTWKRWHVFRCGTVFTDHSLASCFPMGHTVNFLFSCCVVLTLKNIMLKFMSYLFSFDYIPWCNVLSAHLINTKTKLCVLWYSFCAPCNLRLLP